MKSRIKIIWLLLISTFAPEFNSCVHTTQLNELYVNPIDTTQYSSASLTIHGVFATMTERDSIWVDPLDQFVRDSMYGRILERADSLWGIATKFIKDTLVLNDTTISEWDKKSYSLRFIMDSSHSKFLDVKWTFWELQTDGIFDSWKDLMSYDFFNVPFTLQNDQSLTAHLQPNSPISYNSDNRFFQGSSGITTYDTTISLVAIDSLASDSYIDIRISPEH